MPLVDRRDGSAEPCPAATHDGHEVTGRVLRASGTDVTLDIPATRSTPSRTETLAYAGLERAAVQVEFARPDDKDS